MSPIRRAPSTLLGVVACTASVALAAPHRELALGNPMGGWAPRSGAPGADGPQRPRQRAEAWVYVGQPVQSRSRPGLALLGDGTILVTGGDAEGTSEVFDPVTGTHAPRATLNVPRHDPVLLRLRDGRIVVAGGTTADDPPVPIRALEVYDPERDEYVVGPELPEGVDATAPLHLLDDTVLFGGATAVLFDPAANRLRPSPADEPYATLIPALVPAPGGWAGGARERVAIREADGTWRVSAPISPSSAVATCWATPFGTISTADDWTAVDPRFVPLGGEAHQVPGGLACYGWHPTGECWDGADTLTQPLDEGARFLVAPTLPLVRFGAGTVVTTRPPLETRIGGSLSRATPRSGSSMTTLRDGQVWVAGGLEAGAPTRESERLVLGEGRREADPGLLQPRAFHSVTTLPDGRVLVAGGAGQAATEVYDPTTHRSSAGPALLVNRAHHSATPLPGGRILIAGGLVGDSPTASAELVDLERGTVLRAAPLGKPRSGHSSVLLWDGNVLLLGGDVGSPTAEIYDPDTGAKPAFALPHVTERVAAAPLPSGDILVAGEGYTYRIVTGPNFITGIHPGVRSPLGIVAPRPGLHQVCGVSECMGEYAGVPGARTQHPITSEASMVPLPTGQYYVRGLTVSGEPTALQSGDLPANTVPPTLSVVPALVPGTTVTLTGTRFRQPTAVGAVTEGEWVEATPTVYFVPANHGTTVAGRVEHYTSTEIRWRVPSSPYSGPGWLHVVVMGVPSVGHFTTLLAVSTGQACSEGSTCQSGYCVDGVCCDRACDQGCEACTANLTGGASDGVCAPLAAGSTPRFGCSAPPEDTCGPTGTCDGLGGCELPPSTTRCALSAGVEGVCLAGQCVDPPDPACDAEGENLVSATGELTSCNGYRCVAGACLTACRFTSECTASNRCTTEGRCAASVEAIEAAVDPGACAVGGPRGAPGLWALGAGLCLGGLARRRHRPRRAAPGR